MPILNFYTHTSVAPVENLTGNLIFFIVEKSYEYKKGLGNAQPAFCGGNLTSNAIYQSMRVTTFSINVQRTHKQSRIIHIQILLCTSPSPE
jgi:hypothetical protein